MAFHGKVAVVFGGGSGMGRIAARRLADQSAEVAICDVSETGMKETASGRSNVHTYVCDVTRYEDVQRVVAEIEKSLGTIDRVLHTAAIMPGSAAMEDDIARIARVMDINFMGTVHVTRATLPAMIARGHGDFIVWGSVAGEVPSTGLSAYSASKAAVNAYIEAIIWENRGSGVRMHIARPGMVETPLLDQVGKTGDGRLIAMARERKIVATPESIVEEIENALERGEWMSYPSVPGKMLHVARRISPKLLWELISRS